MKQSFRLVLVFLISHLLCTTAGFSQQNYTTKSKKAISYYEEAVKYTTARDGENAKQSLLKAIEKDNQFIEAHMMLAYIYSDLSQPEKAV
jgi:Tfp pilus assembly protein PilF